MDLTVSLWFLPVLGSALGLGFYDLCKKHAVRENSVMPVLFFATLCGSAVFTAMTFLFGDWQTSVYCSAHTWILILLKSMLVSASWICVYYAMRELPISLASPIRASAPLWTFLGSILLYSEYPTLLHAIGMISIFAGYYFFSVFGKLEGFSLRSSRGMHLIILGTLLGAGSALYDKYLLGVLHLPRGAVQFWFSVDLVWILGLAYGLRSWCFGHKHPFQWRWSIPATGILLIAADYLYFYALSLPDTYISVVSLVRRCNCLVTFFVGVIWFKEKNIRKKAFALLLIVLGVFMLAMGNK